MTVWAWVALAISLTMIAITVGQLLVDASHRVDRLVDLDPDEEVGPNG